MSISNSGESYTIKLYNTITINVLENKFTKNTCLPIELLSKEIYKYVILSNKMEEVHSGYVNLF